MVIGAIMLFNSDEGKLCHSAQLRLSVNSRSEPGACVCDTFRMQVLLFLVMTVVLSLEHFTQSEGDSTVEQKTERIDDFCVL